MVTSFEWTSLKVAVILTDSCSAKEVLLYSTLFNVGSSSLKRFKVISVSFEFALTIAP